MVGYHDPDRTFHARPNYDRLGDLHTGGHKAVHRRLVRHSVRFPVVQWHVRRQCRRWAVHERLGRCFITAGCISCGTRYQLHRWHECWQQQRRFFIGQLHGRLKTPYHWRQGRCLDSYNPGPGRCRGHVWMDVDRHIITPDLRYPAVLDPFLGLRSLPPRIDNGLMRRRLQGLGHGRQCA